MISSELLMHRDSRDGAAQIAVAQVQFKNKCVFVAVLLSAEGEPDHQQDVLQALEDSLYVVCVPRRCVAVRVNSAVAAPVTLLEMFNQCDSSEARMIVCRTQEAVLHVMFLLNLGALPVA